MNRHPRSRSAAAPASRSRSGNASPPPQAACDETGPQAKSHQVTAVEWLSLTELGRIYGISAVHTGRLLVQAGLRNTEGMPTAMALNQGLALCPHPGDHHQALWSRQGCGPHLERQGQVPMQQRSMVGLWADLLSALQQGSPSISVSAEEMAVDVPRELVRPVNQELRQRGCSFQVRPLRTTATPRPACSPAPAADSGASHPCG